MFVGNNCIEKTFIDNPHILDCAKTLKKRIDKCKRDARQEKKDVLKLIKDQIDMCITRACNKSDDNAAKMEQDRVAAEVQEEKDYASVLSAERWRLARDIQSTEDQIKNEMVRAERLLDPFH